MLLKPKKTIASSCNSFSMYGIYKLIGTDKKIKG